MVEMMQFIILGVLNVGENQTVTKLLFLFKLEKIKVIQKSNNNLWLFLDTTQKRT